MIPFNKPYLTGKEMHYIYQAVYSGKISGNGEFTKKCQKFFEEKYGYGIYKQTHSFSQLLRQANSAYSFGFALRESPASVIHVYEVFIGWGSRNPHHY